ncbi:MAG: beta-galactosidase [Planctomycetota bacterium]|nr:beta-galactosidase [Planctomycetota bacterium]
MPTVSYNGQSFIVDGRRLWILAGSMHYARIPRAEWADRIAAARQAGFNAIETACPWLVHEPRRGRFAFEDDADVRRFIELCGEARMRVILRPGPFVGAGFDGGGLPGWLTEDPAVVLREGNEAFLERASRYFRRLLGELIDLQASKGGPILLVQVEHNWTCANDHQADRYLREIGRVIRECGITVPLINANNLWPDPVGTIDTWQDDDDLLANLRQLRTVQSEAPRLVRAFEAATTQVWDRPRAEDLPAATMLRRLAEILAAGAQPIVIPFHGGTNFGFLAGRLPGPAGGVVTTAGAAAAPLGEAGARGDAYRHLRRILTFAGEFGHVFADLDPDYQPVALDPREVDAESTSARRGNGRGPSVAIVPLRGSAGRVVFVFADAPGRSITLLLDAGLRLPVELGDQPLGWYVLEADLHGRGRLDYTNLCPLAIVDRAMLVLYGPARSKALLSINGAPLQATVPGGSKPFILEHKGVRLVICNQKQIDATYFDDRTVYIGIDGFDGEGRPRPAAGWDRAWRVEAEGDLAAVSFDDDVVAAKTGRTRRSITLKDWHGASSSAYAAGVSPRFASLKGPETLPACGASNGYGWYRVRFKLSSTKKRLVHAPCAGHRLHFFLDGEPVHVFGEGPGAEATPFPIPFSKGEHVLIALADNFGRFADGNDLGRHVGLWGDLFEVKPIRTAKPKQIEAAPVDPFEVRAFILGGTPGQRSDPKQVQWSFTHYKKSPIIVDVDGASAHGTFVLNDTPIAYYAGETGAGGDRLLLKPPALDAFKRGKNILRFAPDAGQRGATKNIAGAVTIYECIDNLTESASWSFAKWEAPAAGAFQAVSKNAATQYKNVPAWWRCHFDAGELPLPLWLDTAGLSKGQAYVNGRNLGRYFNRTLTGKTVGPQQRLYVPASWLHEDEPNEILIFDEHGFPPHRAKLLFKATGDLD